MHGIRQAEHSSPGINSCWVCITQEKIASRASRSVSRFIPIDVVFVLLILITLLVCIEELRVFGINYFVSGSFILNLKVKSINHLNYKDIVASFLTYIYV